MKQLLLGTVALLALASAAPAADLYTKAPVAPLPPPQFNWTGFYIGGNVGGGWGSFNVTDALTGLTFGSSNRSAFVGGGQIGYNFQVSPYFVLGIEGFWDGIASNNNTGTAVFIPGIGIVTASTQGDWVATVAGRIGLTTPGLDHLLVYFKGGEGWVQTTDTVNTPLGTLSQSRTPMGWMFGGGFEWAFAPNWTARVDYQYIGLDNITITQGFLGVPLTTKDDNVQTITVGINYLFNWSAVAPPVMTRY